MTWKQAREAALIAALLAVLIVLAVNIEYEFREYRPG